MKNFVLIVFCLVSLNSYSQLLTIDEVMGIPIGEDGDTNLSPTEEGAVFYNTDTKELMIFDGTSWVNVSNPTPTVYTGYFIIDGPGGSSETTSTFTKSIDEVPFKPSQVTFIAHANIEKETINDDNGETSPKPNGDNDPSISNSFGTMHGFARSNEGDDDTQQVIYLGASGNSINDISRYASPDHCIGLRYSNQNGDNFGIINGSLDKFNDDGFDIVVNYIVGSLSNLSSERTAFKDEDVLVLFTAYK
ncbi:hypothetical protein ACFQ5N_11685 [Lutibacter holmesii]|uniref:Uncharacterized protein n=1 Tax=Lutibacter holmesii TaxID=1137985 RepID=A0ABW3WQC0_9FLAO